MRIPRIRGGRGVAATLLLTSVLALGACGTPETTTAAPPAAATSTASADKVVAPTKIRIPKIKAESSLVSVGLNSDKSLEIPPVDKPMQAGWYKLGAVPGEPGPTVIVGHVDGDKGKTPGIFNKLKDMAPGDEVAVTKGDGTEAKFIVTRKVQVDKDQLPKDVFADSADSELRLITCGGNFDKAAHSYKDNIVVYAKLAA